jgi:RND family efflux transporter MFP subunit
MRPSALLIAALIAFVPIGCNDDGDEGDTSRAQDAIPVTVATADAVTEPITLELDGTLVADEESDVTPLVPGRVVEVLVERGDRVEEGQPIVRLRDVDYRLQARAARAQLDQARARLGVEGGENLPAPADTPDVRAARADMDLAASNLRRMEGLAEQGAISTQALEQSRTQSAAARERYEMALNGARGSLAALEAARAALDQAATAAGDATVRAPFAGEIANRMASVGEYVSPQSPLVSLVRTDPLRIEVSVPQQHLLDVRPEQRVDLRVDAAPGRSFEGTVRYVSASVDRATRGLTVEAVIPNPDGVLRPGLFATARLETGGTREVARIPKAAVLSRAGVDRVFVVHEGTVEERVVSISDRREDMAVIEEGVSAGETVATDHLEQLSDGRAVTTAASAPVAQQD